MIARILARLLRRRRAVRGVTFIAIDAPVRTPLLADTEPAPVTVPDAPRHGVRDLARDLHHRLPSGRRTSRAREHSQDAARPQN